MSLSQKDNGGTGISPAWGGTFRLQIAGAFSVQTAGTIGCKLLVHYSPQIDSAVVRCCKLLEQDCALQLEGTYGVHADGTVEPLASLVHLDAIGQADRQALVAEVTVFRNRLDRVVLLNLPPDLNDGVTISMALLWELVPWKEAQWMWGKLVAGQCEWSTMAELMKERGLIDQPTTC